MIPAAATAETVVPEPAGTADTAVSQPAATATASAGASTVRVGDDLRAVSLSRFGSVERERYEILGELARGGLGRVLRARDPRTGRIVALKEVLRPSADLLMRFAREALVTANLQHPSIVPVYEVGRWPGGEPFYAMKLVQGRALDEIIAQARTTAARVALVPHVIAIADALAYAHGEHVIHRDLKPGNVLVGAYGETVVIDWGLARNLRGEAGPGGPSDESLAPTLPPLRGGETSTPGETVAGAVVGTPAYMAPEQAKGQPLDERADVYAIGAILYHVLSGDRPYREARTIAAVLVEVNAGPPRRLAELVPDAPPELIAITERAMARAPDDRYPTAKELAEDLRRFVSGQLVGAHTYSRRELLRRWIGRHRAAVLTAGIALAALIGFGAISVRRIAAERDEARRQHDRAERQRAEAQTARALAERRFADSLEELGRQAVRDGAPDRALVFLGGARAARTEPDPALDLMLGQARGVYTGLRMIVPVGPTGTLSADVAAEGARLVTTGAGNLQAWDVDAGTVRWQAEGPHRAALSPDGTQVLAATVAGELVVYAADSGHEVRRWPPPQPPPGGAADEVASLLAWQPGGARFAVGGKAGSITLGAVTGELLPKLGHDGEVHSLAFAPGGAALLSCAARGPAAIHDAVTGERRALLGAPGDRLGACIWLDDDRIAAGEDGAQGTVRIWRVSTRRVERTLAHGGDVYGLITGDDASWLVTYGHGDRAILWDLATGAERARLTGHRIAVNDGVAVGPWVVTSDETGQVMVWDPAQGDLMQRLPAEGLPMLAARGDHLVVYGPGRTRLWRLDPERVVRRLPGHTARVRALRFDRSGAVLWSASHDGSARGHRLDGGAPLVLGRGGYVEPTVRSPAQPPPMPPPNPRGLRSLTFSADGRAVFTTSEDGVIAEWRTADGTHVRDWPRVDGRVRRLVFSADGAAAYTVGDGFLRRWDAADAREVARAALPEGDRGWDVETLGPDRLITVSQPADRLMLWDAATLAPLPPPEVPASRLPNLLVDGVRVLVATSDRLIALDHDGRIAAQTPLVLAFALDLAPDGGPLAVGDSRGDVALVDRTTLAPIRSWNAGATVVAAVRFRPDGAVLATATGRIIHIWDPQTGDLLAQSAELPTTIVQLDWSPDGRYLGFAGGSGTVWLWDLAPPAGDLATFTRCVSPWRLEDSALTAAVFDPRSCAALTDR